MKQTRRWGWALVLLLSQACQPTPAGTPPTPGAQAALVLDDDWSISEFGVVFADLDHDGLDDVIAAGALTSGDHGGGIVVTYGRRARIEGTVSLHTPDLLLTDDRWARERPLLDTGDFDGDGIDDLVMEGHSLDVDAGILHELVRVVYGSDTRRTGVMAIADVGATLEAGEPSLGVFGTSGGDLDGDGIDDLVVSVATAANTVDFGIVHGSHARWSGTTAIVPDAHVTGNISPSGHALTPAGDVDGDGHADLLVQLRNADGTFDLRLLYGPFPGDIVVPATGFTIHDVSVPSAPATGFDANSDGLDDLAIPLVDGTVYVIAGSHTRLEGIFDRAAAAAVLTPTCATRSEVTPVAAGDVDGDGHGDLVIGQPDCGQEGGGQVSLVFGAPSTGSLAGADRTWSGVGGTIDANGMPTPGDGLGNAVAQGDFDGDGHSDTIFTAQSGTFFLRTIELVYGGPR